MNEVINVNWDLARQAWDSLGIDSSLCTIKRAPTTLDAGGQPDLNPANFTPVAGMVNIKCQKAPAIIFRPNASDEVHSDMMTEGKNLLHILLNGYFPGIGLKDVANIDGVDYDIRDIESDSQKTTTRMAVEQVTI